MRLPRQIISVECTGHLDVRDDGVNGDVVDASDPFVRSASFHNLKACVPKGTACKPSDDCIVLDDEYPMRVLWSGHGATILCREPIPASTKVGLVRFWGFDLGDTL